VLTRVIAQGVPWWLYLPGMLGVYHGGLYLPGMLGGYHGGYVLPGYAGRLPWWVGIPAYTRVVGRYPRLYPGGVCGPCYTRVVYVDHVIPGWWEKSLRYTRVVGGEPKVYPGGGERCTLVEGRVYHGGRREGCTPYHTAQGSKEY